MTQQLFTINARKYDGSIHRSWNADLVLKEDSLWLFRGVFEDDVRHPDLGFISRGTVSFEYYWKDEWFNVFRFEEPDGGLRNFYCNINLPPSIEGACLDFVDLDIDILVEPDLSFKVLDREEFEANSERFGYPASVRSGAFRGEEVVKALIENRSGPFSRDAGNILRLLELTD